MTAPSVITIDATTTVTTTVVVPPAASKQVKETPEEKEQRILTLQLLARQLEYYFSTTNLSRDTYLSTLRDLNDSYVPVSIIANFGKVQALAAYESALDAVVAAATDYSELLEIVELGEDGKKINREENKDETARILAVGSITQNPIPMSSIPKTEKPKRTKSAPPSNNASPAPNPEQSVQNTIILREVAKNANEEILRNLFVFEGCPSIESIREDLHNCWFVTLDTTSKDDMFNVMMKLRTAKFPSGEAVKARVKSSASSSPLTPNAVVYNPKIATTYAPQFNSNNGASNNNSRKKRSNKGRNNNNNNGANNKSNKSKNNQQNGGNTNRRRNSKDMNNKQTTSNDGAKNKPKKMTLKAPTMGESNFPSLPPTSDGNSKPFQVEKVPISCEKERHLAGGFSDSSSTVTTSTVSTPTEASPSGVVAGGYAAALLRPAAPPAPTTKKTVVAEKPKQQSQPPSPTKKAKDDIGTNKKSMTKSKESKIDDKKLTEHSSDQPPVTVMPPAWGQGRSFADIVSA